MEFKKDLPEWKAEGVEPPKSLKEEGWKAQNKPPADYFNWFFYKTYQSLLDVVENAQHKSEKGQPGGYAALDSGGKVPSNQLALTKSQVGLGNVDNVQQASKTEFDNHINNKEKHITIAEREKWNKTPTKEEITLELNKKVDKVDGKGLSSNDYTTEEKNKLTGIEPGANKFVHPESHPASMITESPDKQFVTSAKKVEWDEKETPVGAQEKVDALAGDGNTKTVKQLDDTITTHLADNMYQIPTIVGTQIRINRLSDTNRLFFKLDADLTGDITISTDSGTTEKPLVDFDEKQITHLEKGFVEVVADADFFILRNRGVSGADKQALIDIVNEAERNESDLKTQFIDAVNTVDTDGGINLPANAPWAEVLANVPIIKTGKRWATGETTSENFLVVDGLDFKPSIFLSMYTVVGGYYYATWFNTKVPNHENYVFYSRTAGNASPYRAELGNNMNSTYYTIYGGFKVPIRGGNQVWFAFE